MSIQRKKEKNTMYLVGIVCLLFLEIEKQMEGLGLGVLTQYSGVEKFLEFVHAANIQKLVDDLLSSIDVMNITPRRKTIWRNKIGKATVPLEKLQIFSRMLGISWDRKCVQVDSPESIEKNGVGFYIRRPNEYDFVDESRNFQIAICGLDISEYAFSALLAKKGWFEDYKPAAQNIFTPVGEENVFSPVRFVIGWTRGW
jgi:hypothetical protein